MNETHALSTRHQDEEVGIAARVRLPRRVREQQMIDVSTAVFGRHGYHRASMDQIAEQASISKPMLYAYFKSKEGLYAGCLRRAGSDLLDRVRDSFVERHTIEQNLWSGFLAFFNFIYERPDAWQLIRHESFYEVPLFRSIVEGIHRDLRDAVGKLALIASRETIGDPFADDHRRSAAAHALLGAAESLANWSIEHDPDQPPEVPCRQLMNFFWLGFGGLAEGQVWTEHNLKV